MGIVPIPPDRVLSQCSILTHSLNPSLLFPDGSWAWFATRPFLAGISVRVFDALEQSPELGMKIDADDDDIRKISYRRPTLIIWPRALCTYPEALHVILLCCGEERRRVTGFCVPQSRLAIHIGTYVFQQEKQQQQEGPGQQHR